MISQQKREENRNKKIAKLLDRMKKDDIRYAKAKAKDPKFVITNAPIKKTVAKKGVRVCEYCKEKECNACHGTRVVMGVRLLKSDKAFHQCCHECLRIVSDAVTSFQIKK